MTAPTPAALDAYDAGLLPCPGGAPDDWWQDAMRVELARAHDFYAAQVETLTAERDNLLAGLNSIVHCKSGVTRPALREAAAEVLGRRVERWPEDQSPFATLAHEATARALASDTARASAETALAEARKALTKIEARVYGSAVNLGSDIVNLARAALESRT